MIKNLLIENGPNFHYEIIESIIVKCREILNIDMSIMLDIFLIFSPNESFAKYITNKYPEIRFEKPDEYHYLINCTIYDHDFERLNTIDKNHKYIAHEITPRLQKKENVYFLSPLAKQNFLSADILPFADQKTSSSVPIYIIQGNWTSVRRYYKLLDTILQNTYRYKFIIKLVGRGCIPPELERHKDNIIFKNDLNFIDYHKEFLDAYCILPLVSKQTNKQYYTHKLTSTMNYAKGYKLKCLIDKDLQSIYNLDDVEIFQDINDISQAFENTLEIFYKNKTLENK